MKQSEKRNKKGRVAKSALSVALAASMVVSSSTFAFAAPVVEDVSPADVVLEVPVTIGEEDVQAAPEVVEEDSVEVVAEEATEVEEEAVGANTEIKYEFDSTSFSLSKSEFDFKSPTLKSDIADVFDQVGATIKVNKTTITNAGGSNETITKTTESHSITNYFAGQNPLYMVQVVNLDTGVATDIVGNDTSKWDIPTEVGNYMIVIKGRELQSANTFIIGETFAKYSIYHDVKDAARADFRGDLSVYNGKKHEPSFDLYVGGKKLNPKTDYEVVKYENNVNACKTTDKDAAYVEVLFKGDFAARGTEKFNFPIYQRDIATADVSIDTPVTFNGAVQQPEVTVKYQMFLNNDSADTVLLQEGTDYKVVITDEAGNSVTKPMNAGTYKVRVTGINNFTGRTFKSNYVISAQNFNDSTVTVTSANVVWMGNYPHAADIVVTDKKSGEVIDPSNYDIYYKQANGSYKKDAYTANTAEGSYDIKVVAKGTNYTQGDVKAQYKVVKYNDSLEKYILVNKPVVASSTYDKDTYVPEYVEINRVKYYADGNVVAPTGVNDRYKLFDVQFPTRTDSKNAGSYEIQIVGKDEWAGQTETIKYAIAPYNAKDDKDGGMRKMVSLHKTTAGNVTALVELWDNRDIDANKDGVAAEEDFYQLVKGVDYDYVVERAYANGRGDYYNVVITA